MVAPYVRFQFPEEAPPATVATVATLQVEQAKTVASVAGVAGDVPETKNATTSEPGVLDVELYANALRIHGPMSYGMAMEKLSWGATRAGQAESMLRDSGRIRFNVLGRAELIQVDEGVTRKMTSPSEWSSVI